MRVLAFCQHARPKGHVTEIPPGREGFWIPGMPPYVADAVARAALDGTAGVPLPGLLGLGVVVKLDPPPVPLSAGALVKLWVVLAAAAGSIRVQRCIPPDPVWMSEVGVFERGLDNGGAAVSKIAFQRLAGWDEFALVYAGLDQDSPQVRFRTAKCLMDHRRCQLNGWLKGEGASPVPVLRRQERG